MKNRLLKDFFIYPRREGNPTAVSFELFLHALRAIRCANP